MLRAMATLWEFYENQGSLGQTVLVNKLKKKKEPTQTCGCTAWLDLITLFENVKFREMAWVQGGAARSGLDFKVNEKREFFFPLLARSTPKVLRESKVKETEAEKH